jgi:hypothetical protein
MKLLALSAMLSLAMAGAALAEPQKLSDGDMKDVTAGSLVSLNISPVIITQVGIATTVPTAVCGICFNSTVGATGSSAAINTIFARLRR